MLHSDCVHLYRVGAALGKHAIVLPGASDVVILCPIVIELHRSAKSIYRSNNPSGGLREILGITFAPAGT